MKYERKEYYNCVLHTKPSKILNKNYNIILQCIMIKF